MPGKNDIDLIDAALAGDDTDYGDRDVNTLGDDDNVQVQENNEADQQGDGDKASQQETTTSQFTPEGAIAQRSTGPIVPQQPAAGLRPAYGQFVDAKGNVVDKTGKIIAQSGAQTRLWMEAQRSTAQVKNLTTQLEAANRRVQENERLIGSARELAELPTRLGISRDEYNEGLQMMSRWKTDPLGVARDLVARTLALGHNASDILGKSAGDALEMKAIQHLINQSTAPLRQQQEVSARQTEQNVAAERAYNDFIGRYPDATIHQDAIANLMTQQRMPAVDAYFAVKTFALENGLDFTQPLGPQIAFLQQQNQRVNTGQQTQQQQRAPLVNGGGRGNAQQLATQQDVAHADDTWGDILSSVMGRTG